MKPTKSLASGKSASSAGAQRPLFYLLAVRVLRGATKRSSSSIRLSSLSAGKRSIRLPGSFRFGTGVWNRSRFDCQNGVLRKSRFHHVRQHAMVRTGMPSSSASRCARVPLGGEANISATATYTRRPKNRTDTGVARLSHRPHVKLKRDEYASSTDAGTPRGFRG
jgi:hypothetical protein